MLLWNTILVPHEFGSGLVFRELSWAIKWIKRNFFEDEERRIVLRFLGHGGEVSDMLATVDLLRAEAMDGTEIAGYLYGESASAHTVAWAACSHRYTLPNAKLAIHSAAAYLSEYSGHSEIQAIEETTRRTNQRMARVYAAACADHQWDEAYWLGILAEHPRRTFDVYAEDLVSKYRMCELFDPQQE